MKRVFSFIIVFSILLSVLTVGTPDWHSSSPTLSPAILQAEAAQTKLIALTFDDGPGAYTESLLDCLKTHNAKATFFVNGKNGSMGAAYHGDILSRMASEGHQIANHTYDHYVPFDGLSAASITKQVEDVNTLIYEAMGGTYQTLVRTPGGANSATIRQNTPAPIILWSVDTLDWKYRNADTVYKSIMDKAKDGAVVLLHDIHATSVQAAIKAIPALQAKGYELVTVSELYRRRGLTLENGTVYNGAGQTGMTLEPYASPDISIAASMDGEAEVSATAPENNMTLYYTTDGTTPTMGSQLYSGPFFLPYGTYVTFVAYDKFGTRTPASTVEVKAHYEGVFDATYYSEHYADVTTTCGQDVQAMLDHFLTTGLTEDRVASPVFSISYYRENNPDLQEAFGDDKTAYVNHFLKYGMDEGRMGCADFDPISYIYSSPDLRAMYGGDLSKYYSHYIHTGINESRTTLGCTVMQEPTTIYDGVDYADIYDYTYYLNRYTHLKDTYQYDDHGAIAHFVTVGMHRGYQANTRFSFNSYYLEYPDLRRALGDDRPSYYRHFMNHGQHSGLHGTGCSRRVIDTIYNDLDYSAVYNYQYYIENNADVAKACGTETKAFNHFIQHGMSEGRQASAEFNVDVYKNNHKDLQNAYGDNLPAYYRHYIKNGKAEGRIAK